MKTSDLLRFARRLFAVFAVSFGWTAFASPTITSQTWDQTVNAGSPVSFSVTATGIAPLAYQWRKSAGGSSTDISGQTSSTFTIASAQSSDAAGYYCQVSDSSGAAWSGNAILTVNAGVAPSVTDQTWDQTVNAGASATFSVTAGGTAPFSYQWRRSVSGSSTDISGATSSSYTITNAQSSDAVGYNCRISNAYGTTWSGNAILTVNAGVAPSVTDQTWDQTVNAGASATFSVTAGGTAPFSYQWRRSVNGSSTDISGATSSSYTITNAQSGDAVGYNCRISNAYGTTWSGNAILTVNSGNTAPTITGEPQDRQAATGSNVTFSVVAAGTAPLSYQWHKNGSPTGNNSATLTLSNVGAGDATGYDVVVTNPYGSATSRTATLTVGPAGSFTFFEQPRSQRLNPGPTAKAAFSVTAIGAGTLTYQWWHGAAAIPGATSATLIVDPVQSADAGTYYVVVNDGTGPRTSVPATLTVEPAASETQPVVMDVHTAAPNILVVVVQTPTTYETGANAPDDLAPYLDSNSWTVDTGHPVHVYRYSLPWDEDPKTNWNDAHPNAWPVRTRHRLYLELAAPLADGPHTLATPFAGGPTSFTFGSATTFCESIKVNQVGYNKSSAARYANFGVFMGNGGTLTFATAPTYQVFDESTGLPLPAWNTAQPATDMGTDTGTDNQSSGEHVYRLDLAGVPEGGPYFVSVVGAGRSRSFGVGSSYSDYLSYVTFRGLYHQRCGMALEAPYTAWTHASCHNSIALWLRSDKPQDGLPVEGPGDTSMHPIEGGYHDAADMDHTPAHPRISIDMLSFYEAFKDDLDGKKYNIPTSQGENANMPDFLQEILWGVKLWENLQVQDAEDPGYATYHGGVMAGWSTNHTTNYGVHNADHDPFTYGSMAVNAPRGWDAAGNPTVPGSNEATAFAAGIFAHASRLVRSYDPDRANELLTRADAAWGYLKRTDGVNHAQTHFVYAALQLYLATGMPGVTGYDDLHDEAYGVFHAQAEMMFFGPHGNDPHGDGPEANHEGYNPGNIYMYTQTPHIASYLLVPAGELPEEDADLQEKLRTLVLKYADEGAQFAASPTLPAPNGTPYPFGVKNNGGTVNYGSGTTQGRYADILMYAYKLRSDPANGLSDPVKEQQYLNGVSLYADYSLGLNPMGKSYYTGLGTDQPNSPCDCNSWFTKAGKLPDGTPHYRDAAGNPIGNVPGILVYGPFTEVINPAYARSVIDKMVPAWGSLPPQRRYADGWSVIANSEFTTHETIVWNALMYAFLSTH